MASVATERGGTLQGLERGLAVIQAFTHETPSRTLSDSARRTGIPRATARRILLTLELGLRSLSVTLHAADGRTPAALARVSVEEMHGRDLPAMQRTACAISSAWTAHPIT